MTVTVSDKKSYNRIDLGYNLLQNAEVEVIGNMCGMKADCDGLTGKQLKDYITEEKLRLIVDDETFDEHIDFYTPEFSIVYDLGSVTEFDSFYLRAFAPIFHIGRFEVFFSENRENLFDEANRFIFANNENGYLQMNRLIAKESFFYEVEGGKARYVAFKQLSTNDAEGISRITTIGLYSKAVSEQRIYLLMNKLDCNLIADIVSDNRKEISTLTDGIIFNEEHSAVVSGACKFVFYKEEKTDKIVLIGEKAVRPSVFLSDNCETIYEKALPADFEEYEIEHGRIKTVISVKGDKKSKYLALDFGSESVKLEHIGAYRSSFEIKVDSDKVIGSNYLGFGANVLPMHLFPGTLNLGYDYACFELEKCRIAKLKPAVVRVWFQPDWFIMDENDFYNRKYCFNSIYMRGLYKELDAFKQTRTEVVLNFGWKTSLAAQEWMVCNDIEFREAGAPKDLRQYAVALSDLLRELIVNRGFTNIKYVSFFNEPESSRGENGYDFVVPDFKPIDHWEEMLALCDEQLRKDSLRDLIEFWGAENAGLLTIPYVKNVLCEWIERLSAMKEQCDRISLHFYCCDYDEAYDSLKIAQKYANGKDVCLTEFGIYSMHTFKKNTLSVALALMNGGVSTALYWYLSGCFLEGGFLFDGGVWGLPLKDHYGINSVGTDFSQLSLLCHYAPSGSKVLKLKREYPDLHTAAVETADGEISVFIETDASAFEKDIKIDFNLPVNKTFYRHTYNLDTVNDGNAIVPVVDKTIFASDRIEDRIDSKYSFVVYSTIKPVKQVVMDEISVTVKPGETVQLGASVIDGDGNDALKWSICDCYYPFMYKGDITEDGLYTAGPQVSNRNIFRRVAVKAETSTGEYGICLVNTET